MTPQRRLQLYGSGLNGLTAAWILYGVARTLFGIAIDDNTFMIATVGITAGFMLHAYLHPPASER